MMYKCLHLISLQLLVVIVFFSCKKGEGEIPQPPAPAPPDSTISIVKSFTVDSVSQTSFVLRYQLIVSAETTGILFATDSSALNGNGQHFFDVQCQFYNGVYQRKINLSIVPKNEVWFKFYYIDSSGNREYSAIYSQKLPNFSIQNKFIVHGQAEDNTHPKDFYVNFEGTELGSLDNSFVVRAYIEDLNKLNYSASINEKNVPISQIKPTLDLVYNDILFDVPASIDTGIADFKLYYLDKLVYTDKLTIVNGGLLEKTKCPLWGMSSPTFFSSGNKLYVLYLDEARFKLYEWTTGTDTWTNMPIPDSIRTDPRSAPIILNGIIYFSPTQIYTCCVFDQWNPYYYKEEMWTFDIKSKQWDKIELLYTTDPAKERNMQVVESFVYEDKIYHITTQALGGRDSIYGTEVLLKVFDPIKKTWNTMMDITPNLSWFYNVVVHDNRVYLLTSQIGEQAWATTWFKNEFYEIDINNKALIKRNWIADKEVGVANPYIASFKGKIYVYGGYSSMGSNSAYSSLFANYDPVANRWTSVSGYSYYTAWISQTNGFFIPMNDKLYVGLGVNRSTNGNIHGSVINNYISHLSLK